LRFYLRRTHLCLLAEFYTPEYLRNDLDNDLFLDLRRLLVKEKSMIEVKNNSGKRSNKDILILLLNGLVIGGS
jgi:hypothetical protein